MAQVLASVSPSLCSELILCVCLACLAHVEQACVLDRAGNIVMVIIGYMTLVPVLLCLVAAWQDHKRAKTTGEASRLLYVPYTEPDHVLAS